MSRISEIAREMKTWWSDEGSDIEVQDALDEIIRLDDAEQTEPQTDCEGCKFKSGVFCIVDGDCKYFDRYEPKDEPNCSEKPNNSTISKMEQVDKDINVRSKDEPQIQLTARCLNCNNAKACKEKHWEGCVYEPKDEKTCETCRHWKYIAHEWQCEACKCQGYEPKTEPQTERSE